MKQLRFRNVLYNYFVYLVWSGYGSVEVTTLKSEKVPKVPSRGPDHPMVLLTLGLDFGS